MKIIWKYELILLYLLIAIVIVIRVNVERTSYCTPDSYYYLEVSKNIISGLGPVGPKVFDFDEKNRRLIPLYGQTPFGFPEQYPKEFFAVWPLGYPLAIVFTSLATSLEPIWASKVLNLILLAIDFYLLFLLFGKTESLVFYYFCSFSMLEICSHTWSENLFLPCFLLLIYSFSKAKESQEVKLENVFLIALSLAGMCLVRYASVINFIFCACMLLTFIFYKKLESFKSVGWGVFGAGIIVSIYLFNNYLKTGFITGMPRLDTQEFTVHELMAKLFWGLFNSMHIIKEFRFGDQKEMFVYIGFTVIQLGILVLIIPKLNGRFMVPSYDFLTKCFIFSGLLYLIFLIYITFTSTVDPFDYRTLMPFSFPLFIALLHELEKRWKNSGSTYPILIVKSFFVFSLFMNLPKRFILGLII
ncbi:MAG: hypothetical protein K2Q22_05075 [Cytophagales bacterium]|nr:hypothetical protein [Cytophagales bacterium]